MVDRTLDYVPRLDERNRNHRIAAAASPALLDKYRYWTPGSRVLDQGREGACVGFGCTGEYMASPFRGLPVLPNSYALDYYKRAKEIDEWEGVDYSGTSVRAGMLVGREKGWWTGFRWAFNMGELRAALEDGPVVAGVEWRADMYEAPGGNLFATGELVGWHCILLTGYMPKHSKRVGPAYRVRNSWGASWGINGSAYITASELNSILFQAGGEAAVPIGRKV